MRRLLFALAFASLCIGCYGIDDNATDAGPGGGGDGGHADAASHSDTGGSTDGAVHSDGGAHRDAGHPPDSGPADTGGRDGGVSPDGGVTDGGGADAGAHVDPMSVTEEQLRNFRGDFGGIVIPSIAPQCPDDPVTHIKCTGDNGGTPHGLIAGEFFTAAYANYTEEQRAVIRQAYGTDPGVDGKPRGYTHFPLNVNCVPGVAGYHGLYPATDCDAINDLLHELWDSGIYPVCFLSGGEWPVDISRLDKSLCRIVAPMWEMDGPLPDPAKTNEAIAWARDQFPDALLYVHFTSDHHAGGTPEADWWRWAVGGGADQWHSPALPNPHLAGILYQTGAPDDAAATVVSTAYMTSHLGGGADGWPTGADVVIFETDIYQKFWDGRTEAEGIAYNNQVTRYMNEPLCVGAACGQLAGFCSGSTIARGDKPTDDPTKCVKEPFDLAAATVWNSPANIAAWAETTKITRIDFQTDGMHLEFDKADGQNRWPDYTIPGWGGPIQYTLWLALDIGGQWHTAGIIQFWYGLYASGGDVTKDNQIAINWVYDGRWGPMNGVQPAVGEKVGFMVSAGNARNIGDDSQTIVTERSNMVIVHFPAAAGVTVTCDQ